MTKNQLQALRERLQDDRAFPQYLDGLANALRAKLDQIADSQPGAVSTEMIRELFGQYRMIRLIRRELLGAADNEPTT